ncbi:MAG TPA: hypothetical protein VNO55_32420, partial [Polyangia bacterium]|nr:hypothetical protein [Polyangia bacterium]
MSAQTFSSFVAVLALELGACAAAAPPKSRFPSAEAVAQLAAEPLNAPPEAKPVADVADWKLTGPLPDVIDGRMHAATTTWDRLLGEASAGRPGSLLATEAAACAAREIGLFQAAQPGTPPPRLIRFIAARCGVVAPTLATGCRISGAGEGASDEQVFAREAPAVKAALTAAAEQAGAESTEGGLWIGRQETHPLICWAVAPRLLAVQRATLVPDAAGAISIEGELEDVQVEAALVSAGPMGTRPCAVNQDKPPHISVSCPLQRADAAAWIDVTTAGTDDIGGRPVLSLLVWPAGQPDDTYHRLSASAVEPLLPPIVCPSPAGGGAGASLGDRVAGCINQVRQTAGARPLSTADEQSRTVAALAPRLFVALRGGAPAATVDQLSLGVRAGWQTHADLSYGQLAHTAQEGDPDPAAMVIGLLEHPLGRVTLLDKEARLLAVGTTTLPGGGATGLVVATYRVVGNKTVDQSVYI